jgi:ATP-dependent Clp protease protease subunit
MRARITKDWIEAYFEYGIDRQNRRIFMFDGVEEHSIGMVIKGLYYMDAESTEKPIELFIGSFGGSEYEMFALYDTIRTLKSPIHTTAIGKCMSAAPLLVACGEPGHRYATPNTWFMVHQSWGDWDSKRVDEIAKEISHYNTMGDKWYALMGRHTNKPAKFWRQHCQQVGDKYFDAELAQEWGLIDHIWDEKDEEAQDV